MSWVHGPRVIHNDIKLGDVVLIDFGLSTDNPSNRQASGFSVESGSSRWRKSLWPQICLGTIASMLGLKNFYLARARHLSSLEPGAISPPSSRVDAETARGSVHLIHVPNRWRRFSQVAKAGKVLLWCGRILFLVTPSCRCLQEDDKDSSISVRLCCQSGFLNT